MVSLSIGEVARRAGLRPSALRYYERIGVLSPAVRASGRRRYGPDVFRRLRIVEVAQRAGFRLDEIRTLCAGAGAHANRRRWRALAQRKLVEVEDLRQRVEEMKRLLESAIACECSSSSQCRLLNDASPPAPTRRRRGPALSSPTGRPSSAR